MKSKDEIISENGIHLYDEAYQYAGDTEDFRRAMDQYSEQIAIGFAEWIAKRGYQYVEYQSSGTKGWTNSDHFGTTTELFNIYKQ